MVELLVVLALIAIVAGAVSLSIRDPAATKLDHEAVRLAALLESARTEARTLGLEAWWVPSSLNRDPVQAPVDFTFVGLPANEPRHTQWLNEGVTAQVVGARAVLLGPEPVIGAQRIVLRLEAQQLVVATDGLGPFAVVGDALPAAQ